jgi:hypothetical protein
VSEISFCVFVVSGSETESAKFSCVLAKLWVTGWASFSSLGVSDAYASALALAWRKPF